MVVEPELAALCMLVEKSKMKLEGDGRHHESEPEFEVVMSKLKRRREEQEEEEERFYEMRKAFLRRQLEMDGECIRMQYEVSIPSLFEVIMLTGNQQTVRDVKEKNIAWLKEKMMYLAELQRQGKEYPGDDVIPFQYGVSGILPLVWYWLMVNRRMDEKSSIFSVRGEWCTKLGHHITLL